MKDSIKVWVPVISMFVTVAAILWATSQDRANAWAAIEANATSIRRIEIQLNKFESMGQDIAVIKEILKRYDAENQRRYDR